MVIIISIKLLLAIIVKQKKKLFVFNREFTSHVMIKYRPYPVHPFTDFLVHIMIKS